MHAALEMRQRLYPTEPHEETAGSLVNVGMWHAERGRPTEAAGSFRDAARVYRAVGTEYARSATEGDVLTRLAAFPAARSHYLWTTGVTNADAAGVYAEVWADKGAVARVYERRHLAARAATNPQAAALLAELTDARRKRAELLLTPAPRDAATLRWRNDRLRLLDDTIAGRDAAVRPLLPDVGRAESLAAATPDDLRRVLPVGAVVVDFLWYDRIGHDRRRPGAVGGPRTPSYAAFVVTRHAVRRVELGPAGPIEEAVAAWRKAITDDRPIPDAVAGRVRELVWEKVRREIPAGTSLVYVSPDRDLFRVPWAALPGDKLGTVLLEDVAVATLPHAPFLLDKLRAGGAPRAAAAGLLAVGGVDYEADAAPTGVWDVVRAAARSHGEPAVRSGDAAAWPPLRWASAEARGAVAAAGSRFPTRLLDGAAATADRVLAELPTVRFAHLATHGFFAAPEFRSALRLDPNLFDTRPSGERVGPAALSPMVMTGLVFAGANRPATPGRGIVTGEALIDRDLSGLELAVLSACETGLGDVAGGEGTFGLQRAFHVAGARDVVASLWSIPDRSTAAVMGEFYRNRWERNLPPAEALRQAQLRVYRNPGDIPALA
jgi:CHAT domain-containing protein